MSRRFSINFSILAFLLDGLLVAASLYAANLLRPLLNELPFVAYFPDPVVPPLLYPVFGLLWGLILVFFAVYDGRRRATFLHEWLDLTLGSSLAAVSLAGVLYLSFREMSRVQFLTFIGLGYLSLLGWRLIYRAWEARRPGLRGQKRVLVIGGEEAGQAIAEKIQGDPGLGLELGALLESQPGVNLPEQARRVIEAEGIAEVVIALPEAEHAQVTALVQALHLLPVGLWVIPNYFQLALFRAGLAEFAGIPMLDLHAPAISEYQRVVKRLLDLIVSAVVLVPGIPLMALTALAVWLSSGRPVLFRQERVGESGRLFAIYKFRTMVPDADQLQPSEMEHKRAGDPRVTSIGRILRRLSLDELPQFFNVLKGEMSLVGPRPELPWIVAQYEPWQRQRFTVPPGITGWWQVSGRSEKLMHLHTEDDLYYIRNYSLFLDLQILVKTVWVVLKGEGAW